MSIDTAGIESADLKDYHSDEGPSLGTSALETLYGGQFTLSTQLLNQIILLYPADAAPQFFLWTYPVYSLITKKSFFSQR